MLDEIVSITPQMISDTGLANWLNRMPNVAMHPAAPTIIHFRSTLSATIIANSGPNGAAMAMMKV